MLVVVKGFTSKYERSDKKFSRKTKDRSIRGRI